MTHSQQPAALTAAALLLTACGSTPPTRFYTLASADGTQPVTTARIGHVTVGQLNLPRMVDKPQIVRRISPDQITLQEFDRWAAPLEDNAKRVFTIDMDHALPPGTVIRSNGTPYDTTIGIIDLDFDRFDVDPAGLVTMDVSWSLTSGNPQTTLLRRSEHITQTGTSGSTSAAVHAMGVALNELAEKVAAELPPS